MSAQHEARFHAVLGERDRRASALAEVAGTKLNGGDRLWLALYALLRPEAELRKQAR